METEIRIGQLIQIENGPLLSFEDDRAPEAQDPLGDDAVRAAVAAGAALSPRRREQPVVRVWRRTETGEAPRWQGATTENRGPRRACFARRGGNTGSI